MSLLATNLFDRRFADLVEQGRSRLPSLAPAWTDHNAHDPGIMLMELLAWVAEAQIYSLARARRDERGAYAALMGLNPRGARPAHGLIWPDHDDPNSPATRISRSFVIERDAAIYTSHSEVPTFRPTHRILWVPARIRALVTRLAGGTRINHIGANQRGGPAFQPFGESAGRNDILRMELESIDDSPLIPPTRPDDACLVIGVRADTERGDPAADDDSTTANCHSSLEVMLLSGADRFPLRIIEDTSEGFMRTGACVLDLSEIPVASPAIALELRSPRGFDRPPRVLRIDLNVVPISQSRRIERELHIAQGFPDQVFDLDTPGLQFESGTSPVKLEVGDRGAFAEWKQSERLADCGPDDLVYELDPVAGRITFGNGINGRMPATGAQIFATYLVCEGAGGNTARSRKWIVHGVSGVYGLNPDPIAGGQDPSGSFEQRREARRAAKEEHALVSSADIESAARALPALKVSRAWVLPLQARAIETGEVTLIAMQARAGDIEPATIPETPRWLEAIRRRLSPRMPLGSRLTVVGPRYADFTIRCRVESEIGRDPASVKKAVEAELRKRLALVAEKPSALGRAFGLPVTRRDLTAWIQALPDVRRVPELLIIVAGRKNADEVKVPRHGLPRIDLMRSTIEIVRAIAASPQ